MERKLVLNNIQLDLETQVSNFLLQYILPSDLGFHMIKEGIILTILDDKDFIIQKNKIIKEIAKHLGTTYVTTHRRMKKALDNIDYKNINKDSLVYKLYINESNIKVPDFIITVAEEIKLKINSEYKSIS
ncbi:hypothetical protein [Clostridium tarantellae]|uniref:Uncharacterized protein n=1 Tax=Clostridium tarantellae TaxID=39493 RepID=A0A6I1MSZ2_9CLOT|nr:hypothetical protein [Clostridium tarantellae]MPQ45262.1 hypothetical protein [Clostridium tarantellae]